MDKGRSFEPLPGEQPLNHDEILRSCFDLYAAEPRRYEAYARRLAARLGLDPHAEGDPRWIVGEAILALADRTGRSTTLRYRSGGPGLLSRQIFYTCKELARSQRRGDKPVGNGSDADRDSQETLGGGGSSDVLAAMLDAQAATDWRLGQADPALEAAFEEELGALVATARQRLRQAIDEGECRLTIDQYEALCTMHRRSRRAGSVAPERIRTAATRARQALRPVVARCIADCASSLESKLEVTSESRALPSAETMADFLDAVGFFDGDMAGLIQERARRSA